MKLCLIDVRDITTASHDSLPPLSMDVATMIRRTRPFLLFNKLDSVDPTFPEAKLRHVVEEYGAAGAWAISLRTGAGVDMFIEELGKHLHEQYVRIAVRPF